MVQPDINRLIRIYCMTIDQLCSHPEAKLDYKAVFIAAAKGMFPVDERVALSREIHG